MTGINQLPLSRRFFATGTSYYFATVSLILALTLGGCSLLSSRPATSYAGPSFDSRLENFAYPFPVQFYEFEAQGEKLQMAYMDLKPEKATGKTAVLLHGKNFSGFYFEKIAREFLAKGYRVVIPDQIGFGKSTKPAHFQYSFQALGTFTRKLLQKLEVTKYTLLGHSMGGMLAMRMALMEPEPMERLILVCPLGLEDYRLLVPYKTIDDAYAAEFASTPESIKKYQQENYFAGNWKPEYDALIAPASGWTIGSDFPLVAWNAALTSDMIYTQPVFWELKNIKVPTILFVGSRDKTAPGKAGASPENQKKLGDFPTLGRAAQDAIPRAKFIELKGRGHVPFLEDFEEFRRLLDKQI
jgi:pimeloyl-ACP methyl ester carboxylesterase